MEEIGTRLAAEEDTVVVYCRRHNSEDRSRTFRGMRRVLLPSIKTLQLDTISHSLLAVLHMRFRRPADVIHFHGMGNALVLPAFFAALRSRPSSPSTVSTGTARSGDAFASWMLRKSAAMAVKWADHLIIDNHPARKFFKDEYGASSSYVVYGADPVKPTSTEALGECGVEPKKYVLFVGALVPDKGPDMLIEAYRRLETDYPLIIVGDSPFVPEYRAKLRELADGDERFPLPWICLRQPVQAAAGKLLCVCPPAAVRRYLARAAPGNGLRQLHRHQHPFRRRCRPQATPRCRSSTTTSTTSRARFSRCWIAPTSRRTFQPAPRPKRNPTTTGMR